MAADITTARLTIARTFAPMNASNLSYFPVSRTIVNLSLRFSDACQYFQPAEKHAGLLVLNAMVEPA
jgi:hypothetical protein